MTSFYGFVVKTLCDHLGALDFKRLNEAVVTRFPSGVPYLRTVLFDDGKVAIRGGAETKGSGLMSPDSLVVAKTSVRLCQKKPGACSSCDGLHLCRYHVCGECVFGLKCKSSHHLTSPHNVELLKKHGLHELSEKQLFQLLLQNDSFLLPEICPFYNKGSGEHGGCRFSSSCTKLHICQHFLQDDCRFGSSCKRIHNIDADMKIFNGFSRENCNNLREIYRNKFIILGLTPSPAKALPEVKAPAQLPSCSKPGPLVPLAPQPRPTSEEDKTEICLFFIRKHCSFQEKCVRVHWHLPYRWQLLQIDGVTWKDLPDMEDIEKAYCEPARHSSTNTQESLNTLFRALTLRSPSTIEKGVDFMTMTCGGSPVRRLSTASSVSKPPHFILTTQWLWYWKDESGTWVEFGQGDVDKQASVTSETLENIYLADRSLELPFSAGSQHYVLHFKGKPGTPQMYQENIKYKTIREVRRRPRLVSSQDVKVKLQSPTSSPSSSSSSADSVPAHWDKRTLPDLGFALVALPSSDKYYDMIERLFKRTLPLKRINSIKRIQNPSLWKVFQWQKEQMTKMNKGKAVNQQYLFHGTDPSLTDAICEQNFDWRMCGVHGVAYGKGSYFAKDASYSDRYAGAKSSRNKVMLVALVLVGEFCRGSSSYVRPPPKGLSRTLYDSCVDNETNPSIYVIFEKQQIYPEYIIDYS